MVYKLYRTPIPRDALQEVDPSIQRQLARAGVLNGGASAQNIAGQPADLRVRGDYRAKYAELLGSEIRELLQSDLSYLPLYNEGGDTLAERGFYTVQQGASRRVDARSARAVSFSGRLVKRDTRASAWVAIETNPTQPDPGNDFGNETTAEVGVPAAATRVRWYDAETGELAEPAIQESRAAEFGTLEVVDAQAAPFAAPTLIYDLPYGQFGDVDVGVWDTYGRPKRDGGGIVAWQRVFDPAHDYRGASVLDTGLLRVTADADAHSLAAETWDDSAGQWSSLALGTSDWELYDWDIRTMGPISTTVLAEFRDATQSPTAFYALRGTLTRGATAIQWFIPDGGGAVPSGLQSLLEPIADGSVVATGATSELVTRREVR